MPVLSCHRALRISVTQDPATRRRLESRELSLLFRRLFVFNLAVREQEDCRDLAPARFGEVSRTGLKDFPASAMPTELAGLIDGDDHVDLSGGMTVIISHLVLHHAALDAEATCFARRISNPSATVVGTRNL